MQSQGLRLLGLRGTGGHRQRGGARPDLVRDHGFDTKFAMHCARLGFQGIELLTTGKLALPMEGEPARWLLAVRKGEVGFDEWWSRALELDAELGRLESDDSIPPGPDRPSIDAWVIAAHLRHWRDA
jgi:hypothetical protein